MNKEEKNKYLEKFGINFVASVATIASVILALIVFSFDSCNQGEKVKQKYINSLQSLNFELQKNNDIILNFFRRDEKQFLDAKQIPYYRYSTSVTNSLIAQGVIQNITLLRNLDAIADNENQINRILDSVSLMADLSHTISPEESTLFQNRIKTAQKTILDLNGELEKYFPKVKDDLKKHIEETDAKKTHWFCIKTNYIQELPPEIFK